MIKRLYLIIGVVILIIYISLITKNACALTPEENSAILSTMNEKCSNRMWDMMEEEVKVYRGIQYGESKSVLGTNAKTEDLIPYLTSNYHALGCKLRMVCDAVGSSYAGEDQDNTDDAYHRPIGCSRMFAARGRWWDPERRDEIFAKNPIEECNYSLYVGDDVGYEVSPTETIIDLQCHDLVDRILMEEKQMMKMVVAGDSVNRGMRNYINVFQISIGSIRNDFLFNLRKITDFFGSVLHPIPCLVTQCT